MCYPRSEHTDLGHPAPKQKILSVNGQPYSATTLSSAITQAKQNSSPIHLELQQDAETFSAKLQYHDGERFPNLERDNKTNSLLDAIIQPHNR